MLAASTLKKEEMDQAIDPSTKKKALQKAQT